ALELREVGDHAGGRDRRAVQPADRARGSCDLGGDREAGRHDRGQRAPELAELLLPDQAAWRAWLEANHAESPGVRLVLARKGATATSLVHAEALEEALC